MPGSPGSLSRLACALLLAGCQSSGEATRLRVTELADRRVARPDAWDDLLTRQSASGRAAAARAAGQVRDPRLAGVIARALEIESDDDARVEQLFALGQIGDPSSASAVLVRLDANVPALRAAAAEALGKLLLPRTAATLVAHMLDPAAEVRGATLQALARIAGRRNVKREALDPEAQAAFLRNATALLDDPEASVRWKAAYALAEIEVPGRATALRHAASANEDESRFFAMGGLVRLVTANEVAAADFLPRLKDRNVYVAALAATGLGLVGDLDAVAPLVSALSDRTSPERWHLRRAAVAALAAIVRRCDLLPASKGDARRVEALKACRKATEFETLSVAAEAMKAVIALTIDPAQEVIAEFETDWGGSPSPHVRVAFVHAIAGAGFERGGERLLRLARDADPYVASEALGALQGFADEADRKSPRDAARLAQLADVARAGAAARDVAVVASALELLKATGGKDDFDLVADVYARLEGDDATEARVAAIHVAAALAGPQSGDVAMVLRGALADPSPAVRAAAQDEWKRLALPDEPPALARLSGRPGSDGDGGERPSSITLEAGVDYLSSRPDPRIVLHFKQGDVLIELLRELAPHHVKMMIERVRAGRCDGLPIHRVVSGFVVQGLDPRGDGWGTGGVFLRDEIGRVPYLRGTIGMPNAGPDSGGCQLFVSLVPTPHLDGRYTVFGRVVSGMDVVDSLDIANVCTKAEVIP